MNWFKIKIIITVFIAAVISLSCSRGDMYTLAGEGVPVVYAVSWDGASTGKLIIAGSNGYVKVHDFPLGSTPTAIVANRKGRVIVYNGSNFFTHQDDDYSGTWNTLTNPSGTYLSMAADDDNHYLYMDDTIDMLYYYDHSTGDWSTGSSFALSGTDFCDFFYSPDKGSVCAYRINFLLNEIYFYMIRGGNLILEGYPSTTYGTTAPEQGFRSGDFFYSGRSAGTSELYIYSSDLELTTTSISSIVSASFAVIDRDNIYAVVNSTSDAQIYRLDETNTWVSELTIGTGGPPQFTASAFGKDHIVIGINSSGSYNGLYFYNIRTKSLKWVTDIQIFAMDVK